MTEKTEIGILELFKEQKQTNCEVSQVIWNDHVIFLKIS